MTEAAVLLLPVRHSKRN